MKYKSIHSSKAVIALAAKLIHLRRHAITKDSKKAINIINQYIKLNFINIASGTKCWDWVIPKKWDLIKAEIKYENKKIFDHLEHVMAVQPYSSSFTGEIALEELKKHIIYNKNMPDAYAYNCKLAYRHPYEKDWLISIPYNRVKKLKKGKYFISIKSKFSNDKMLIGEKTIKGKTDKNIILLSDICHPGQADDGIVGIALWVRIIQALSKRKKLNYTYKFFTPTETIGSIAWLWKRKKLISKIKAGIFLESIGNKEKLKCKLSHKNNAEIDKIAKNVFQPSSLYSFSEGVMNDELVFADSDFNIPMISLQRFPYPEYHTSKDNIEAISENSLEETYIKTMQIIDLIEANYTPHKLVKGPFYLSKHKLYIEAKNKSDYWKNWNLMNSISSGKSILEISEDTKIDFWDVYKILEKFRKAGLIKAIYN